MVLVELKIIPVAGQMAWRGFGGIFSNGCGGGFEGRLESGFGGSVWSSVWKRILTDVWRGVRREVWMVVVGRGFAGTFGGMVGRMFGERF